MQVTLHDSGDLKQLNRALGKVANGRQLKAELRSGFRAVLRPYVPEVRAAYRAMASGRGSARRRGGSLRGALARSVRVEVRLSGKFAGARIRADGRRMPDHMKSLPAYVEGEKPRWRHPVFGDREVWVAQAPSPVFYRTLRPSEAAARREIQRVLQQVQHKLERGR